MEQQLSKFNECLENHTRVTTSKVQDLEKKIQGSIESLEEKMNRILKEINKKN